MPGTRKLGRTSDSRNAMLRAMVTYLLRMARWRPPSPAPRKFVHGREDDHPGQGSDLHSKRQVYAYITKEDVAKKVSMRSPQVC